MSSTKIVSGVRKVIDATIGNLGFGLGFGSAYAAEIPVLGVPFDSLNKGVGAGYQAAQVRITASKIVSGKTSVEAEFAKLSEEQRAHLQTHVQRVKGNIKPDERVTPQGEVLTGRPFGSDLEDPAFGTPS